MAEDPDESEFRFGVASGDDGADDDGRDGPRPTVPDYSEGEPVPPREDDEPADAGRLEPGRPSLESVVFVVLGALATLAVFARMFPFF